MPSNNEIPKIPKVLIFSSTHPNVGKSTIIAALSIFLNSKNIKVVILDCNYIQPNKLPNLLASPNTELYPDLSVILNAGKTKYRKPYFLTNPNKISIFPSYLQTNILDLCHDKTILNLLLEIKRIFDFIIINLPPYNKSSNIMHDLIISYRKYFELSPLGIYVSTSQINSLLEIDRLLRSNAQFYYLAYERILFIINNLISPKKEMKDDIFTINHTLAKSLFQLPAVCEISYIADLDQNIENVNTIIQLLHNDKSLYKQNLSNLFRTLLDYYESLDSITQQPFENKWQPITDLKSLDSLKVIISKLSALISAFFTVPKSFISHSISQLDRKVKLIFQIPSCSHTTKCIFNLSYKENFILTSKKYSILKIFKANLCSPTKCDYHYNFKIPLIKVNPIYKFNDNFKILKLNIISELIYIHHPPNYFVPIASFTYVFKSLKVPGFINIIEFYNNKSWQLSFYDCVFKLQKKQPTIQHLSSIKNLNLCFQNYPKAQLAYIIPNNIIKSNKLNIKLPNILIKYFYKKPLTAYPTINDNYCIKPISLSLSNSAKSFSLEKLPYKSSIHFNSFQQLNLYAPEIFQIYKKDFFIAFTGQTKHTFITKFDYDIKNSLTNKHIFIQKLPRSYIYSLKPIFSITQLFTKLNLSSNKYINKICINFAYEIGISNSAIQPFYISLKINSQNKFLTYYFKYPDKIKLSFLHQNKSPQLIDIFPRYKYHLQLSSKDDFSTKSLKSNPPLQIIIPSDLAKFIESFDISFLHFEIKIPQFIAIKSYLLIQKFDPFRPTPIIFNTLELTKLHKLHIKSFDNKINIIFTNKIYYDYNHTTNNNKTNSTSIVSVKALNFIRKKLDYCGFNITFNKLKLFKFIKPSTNTKFQIFHLPLKIFAVKDFAFFAKYFEKYIIIKNIIKKIILHVKKFKPLEHFSLSYKINLKQCLSKNKFEIYLFKFASEVYYQISYVVTYPKYLSINSAREKYSIVKVTNLSIITTYLKDLAFNFENTENFSLLLKPNIYKKLNQTNFKYIEYTLPYCWYHTLYFQFFLLYSFQVKWELQSNNNFIYKDIFTFKAKFNLSSLSIQKSQFQSEVVYTTKFIFRIKATSTNFNNYLLLPKSKFEIFNTRIISNLLTPNVLFLPNFYLFVNFTSTKKTSKFYFLDRIEKLLPTRNLITFYKFLHPGKKLNLIIPSIIDILYNCTITNWKSHAKLALDINFKNYSKNKRIVSFKLLLRINKTKSYHAKLYSVKSKLSIFKPPAFKIQTNLVGEVYKIIKHSLSSKI